MSVTVTKPHSSMGQGGGPLRVRTTRDSTPGGENSSRGAPQESQISALSLIHISEPTRPY